MPAYKAGFFCTFVPIHGKFMKTLIKKASGELVPFSSAKLRESLVRSGSEEEVINQIVREVEVWLKGKEIIPSKQIYAKAFAMLRKLTTANAARYKLKAAMMELGPTGHPFEFFVGEIYRTMGFDVKVSEILDGHCVTHEVDVVATKENHQRFIECKYYQSTGKNANVQVPLYIRSRVDDIIRMRKSRAEFENFTFSGGVVTNTRFTTDAEAYGECSGLHLLSWDYPKGNGLREIIDREKIFPITSLTSLTTAHKQALMEKGIVICRQILREPTALDSLNLSNKKYRALLEELNALAG